MKILKFLGICLIFISCSTAKKGNNKVNSLLKTKPQKFEISFVTTPNPVYVGEKINLVFKCKNISKDTINDTKIEIKTGNNIKIIKEKKYISKGNSVIRHIGYEDNHFEINVSKFPPFTNIVLPITINTMKEGDAKITFSVISRSINEKLVKERLLTITKDDKRLIDFDSEIKNNNVFINIRNNGKKETKAITIRHIFPKSIIPLYKKRVIGKIGPGQSARYNIPYIANSQGIYKIIIELEEENTNKIKNEFLIHVE